MEMRRHKVIVRRDDVLRSTNVRHHRTRRQRRIPTQPERQRGHPYHIISSHHYVLQWFLARVLAPLISNDLVENLKIPPFCPVSPGHHSQGSSPALYGQSGGAEGGHLPSYPVHPNQHPHPHPHPHERMGGQGGMMGGGYGGGQHQLMYTPSNPSQGRVPAPNPNPPPRVAPGLGHYLPQPQHQHQHHPRPPPQAPPMPHMRKGPGGYYPPQPMPYGSHMGPVPPQMWPHGMPPPGVMGGTHPPPPPHGGPLIPAGQAFGASPTNVSHHHLALAVNRSAAHDAESGSGPARDALLPGHRAFAPPSRGPYVLAAPEPGRIFFVPNLMNILGL
jgi:hypothetical protein